jgi:hypothetical protein
MISAKNDRAVTNEELLAWCYSLIAKRAGSHCLADAENNRGFAKTGPLESVIV